MKAITLLKTTKIGPKLWILDADMSYLDKLGVIYTVPKGFITDGASNIRLLWSLCPPMSGKTAEAAVLHDFLYSKDCIWGFSRQECDEIFLETMLDAGTNKGRAYAVYSGVRAGGSSSYQSCYYSEKFKKDSVTDLAWDAIWSGLRPYNKVAS